MTGQATGGKPINLAQLQTELQTASVPSTALGFDRADANVYEYDAAGHPADFPANVQPTVDTVIANHVAMRDKTDVEYSAEFQASSDPVRKQDIRDQMNGLMPREQVQITQQEWDNP